MWRDSPTTVPCWWRKPVVKVCLHSVPAKIRKHYFTTGSGCAVALNAPHAKPNSRSFILLALHSLDPEARCQQGPAGLSWWRLLPPPSLHQQCSTLQWWWGFWRDASLHLESPLLPPVSVQVMHSCVNGSVSTYTLITNQTSFLYRLTSRTNQLTGDLRKRKADTRFFHQFHQCSLPDHHKHESEKKQ